MHLLYLFLILYVFNDENLNLYLLGVNNILLLLNDILI